MSENNTHLGETKEERLRRFEEGSPIEIIETLINSIASYFINELGTVFENPENRQTSLMFLGTHSIALTIGYGLFNKGGPDAYKLFLENFIDGDTPDKKFSEIAKEIHEWRNVIAHRWINTAGHSIVYDFDMSEGWKKEGEFLILNPQVYLDQYIETFNFKGRIYRYQHVLSTEELLSDAKQRFISKYVESA